MEPLTQKDNQNLERFFGIGGFNDSRFDYHISQLKGNNLDLNESKINIHHHLSQLEVGCENFIKTLSIPNEQVLEIGLDKHDQHTLEAFGFLRESYSMAKHVVDNLDQNDNLALKSFSKQYIKDMSSSLDQSMVELCDPSQLEIFRQELSLGINNNTNKNIKSNNALDTNSLDIRGEI